MNRFRTLGLAAAAVLGCAIAAVANPEPPRTGPETEKRFPPLRIPDGFAATLFACDPLVEYPSAIALGPAHGSLFVAVDYMTGLGTEIIRRDEVRLVEDTDGDGYADQAPVWAAEFNSIQGMTYHDGTLFVMHSPFLTALRDTDGDGRADERRDLFAGLGFAPEKDPVRLHNANGIVAGYDGWLYLALGDHGCDVARPEGDRLVLEGGGILRCRSDGRDLHIFSTGLRNIYDVALDDALNVFVRDNENDGGDYKIRVCHSFFAADHGYPYLYYERPDEALTPLADLGLGSSAGGVCYLERQFPAEFRSQLFFCEWGKAVVRYAPRRNGGGFTPVAELPFAAAADNDPYGFKPTDLVVDRDGSLLIADWADGQRPKRGRARIYRVRFTHQPAKPETRSGIHRLDSESFYTRLDAQLELERQGRTAADIALDAISRRQLGMHGRMHAVWVLAHTLGRDATDKLLELAETDPDAQVQSQAVRALADLADPVLAQHRLDAGRGDAALAERLAAIGVRANPQVLLEVIHALGRLRWTELPVWLQRYRTKLLAAQTASSSATRIDLDATLAHAAMQAMRRSGNWPAVLELLEEPTVANSNGSPSVSLRGLALRSIAGQYDPQLIDRLVARLNNETDGARRLELADLLCRVHRKPAPWVYWGFRPPPRTPHSVDWEHTARIEQALDQALSDPDPAVCLAVLRRMQREKVPTRLESLGRWLAVEQDAERLAAIIDSIREHPRDVRRDVLEPATRDAAKPVATRRAALALWAEGIEELPATRLLVLAHNIEDGPVLADVIRQIGKYGKEKRGERSKRDGSRSDESKRDGTRSVPTTVEESRAIARLLLGKIDSGDAAVRAAAISSLSAPRVAEAAARIGKLLEDSDAGVRSAAAAAAARLEVRSAIPTLLDLARDADVAVRQASLDTLRQFQEPRAVPAALTALENAATQHVALECLASLGGPEHAQSIASTALNTRSADLLARSIQILADWADRDNTEAERRAEIERAIATIQGSTGVLLRWHVAGPMPADDAVATIERLGRDPKGWAEHTAWRSVIGTGPEARGRLAAPGPETDPPSSSQVWLAYADVVIPQPANLQFFGSSDGPIRVWLDGRQVYHRAEPRRFQLDSDRFEVDSKAGTSRLLLQLSAGAVAAAGGETRAIEFHARFRQKGSRADHERLMAAALARGGNTERGRKLLLDVEKTQCLKCHRLGERGEPIGPALTGIGGRFSRMHIIESVLEPSRTITAGYQSLSVSLEDGRVLTGMKLSETAEAIVLADQQGKTHSVAREGIDESRPSASSIMPDGLERSLTVDEFVDLIGYLSSEKTPLNR